MEGAGASIGTKTSRHEKPVEKEEQRRGKEEGEPAQHGESPSTRMAKDVVNARQSGETPGTPAVSGRVCKRGGWVVKKGEPRQESSQGAPLAPVPTRDACGSAQSIKRI